MNSQHRVSALLALTLALALIPPVHAAKPGGGGGSPGSGGTKTPPAPDIVYLSASSQAFNSVGIRGSTLVFASDGTLSSTDSSLLKPASGRESSAVAWSPDGKKFAWIENGAIMTAAPGGKPTLLYPTRAGDPRPLGNPDALAWGGDCSGSGDSVIAFLAELPSYSIDVLTISAGAVTSRETVVPLPTHCNADQTECTMAGGNAFAFSPLGQFLAFYGFADGLQSGVWAAPMCVAGHVPAMILDRSSLGGTDPVMPVMAIDWSARGGRLALSVTTGPDPKYPWRDIKIADLNYSATNNVETVSAGVVRQVNPGSSFGAASSEASPVWDRSSAGDGCQRLAFSQSSDAGRAMYLVDLSSGSGCRASVLRPVSAQNPRALDWRAIK